jgi:acylphosphatase
MAIVKDWEIEKTKIILQNEELKLVISKIVTLKQDGTVDILAMSHKKDLIKSLKEREQWVTNPIKIDG